MSAVIRIDNDDLPVALGIDGSSLEAPDFVGNITDVSLSPTTRRADGEFADRLNDSLEEAGMNYHKLLEIEVEQDGMAGGSGTTRGSSSDKKTRQGEPAIVLCTPPVSNDCECAVLYTDEAGRNRWIWPQNDSAGGAIRSGRELTFLLPRGSAPRRAPDDKPKQRGELTKLGRRLVRVLYWATDWAVGAGAQLAAELWEKKRRLYAFRRFPVRTEAPVSWDELSTGRALLLLHGTFSSAASAFGEVPPATAQALAQHYGGRVFAFDHPSLHHSPQENVERFYEMVPKDVKLELDVITHSRGGLVARELIERQHDAVSRGRTVHVHKAVFVAAPNIGTKLADGDHGTDLLDAYTDLLTELPDDAFSFTIEGVLTLVKVVAHGALGGLPGLNCMLPTGDYLKGLNVAGKHETKYYAAATDFVPHGQGMLGKFGAFLKGGLLYSIFGEENDGVVPTRGCYDGVSQAVAFPIPGEQRLRFGGDDGVHHCNFFGNQRLADSLVQWLTK